MSMITPNVVDQLLTVGLRLSQELQIHPAQGGLLSRNASLRWCGFINSLGYLAGKMPSSAAHDGQGAVVIGIGK